MMDRSTATTATTVTTTPISVSSNQIHPFLLGHHISTYSTALCADGAHPKATQLPFFTSSNGEGGALLPSFDPAAVVYGNRGKPPQEPELDGYDCESEEGGLEVAEESPKRTASRGSGSKRSRAAEVHNLSEKRRRSRINEKMKALQKLIPNSNKTDKASMLDEAIDYLKHLQMQVQMLSMRNGISLNPSYIPPSLHSPQPPQIRYGSDSSLLLNVGMGMVSLDPSKSSSFTLSNHGATSSHQTLLQNSSNISNPIVSFAMDSLQSEHGFFTLPLVTTQGTYREDAMQDHLNPSDAIRSDEARILSRLNSQEDLSMDQANPVHIQHIQHNLDTQQKYLAAGNAKPENPEVQG